MSSELDGLCCPLTLEVFEDPCTLVGDGHTYERSSIQAWLDSGKLTSPTTGATLGLGGTRLVPNYAVKRTIAELAARGRLPPKGTSPRLATEVSQLAAAAEVVAVADLAACSSPYVFVCGPPGLSAACAAAALEHDVAFHSEVFAF